MLVQTEAQGRLLLFWVWVVYAPHAPVKLYVQNLKNVMYFVMFDVMLLRKINVIFECK